jgi:hypothetical protein
MPIACACALPVDPGVQQKVINAAGFVGILALTNNRFGSLGKSSGYDK